MQKYTVEICIFATRRRPSADEIAARNAAETGRKIRAIFEQNAAEAAQGSATVPVDAASERLAAFVSAQASEGLSGRVEFLDPASVDEGN